MRPESVGGFIVLEPTDCNYHTAEIIIGYVLWGTTVSGMAGWEVLPSIYNQLMPGSRLFCDKIPPKEAAQFGHSWRMSRSVNSI